MLNRWVLSRDRKTAAFLVLHVPMPTNCYKITVDGKYPTS